MHLTPDECEHALNEMDTDPDGDHAVNLEMIVAWLQGLNLIGEDVDYGAWRTPEHGSLSADPESASSETLASDMGSEAGS